MLHEDDIGCRIVNPSEAGEARLLGHQNGVAVPSPPLVVAQVTAVVARPAVEAISSPSDYLCGTPAAWFPLC